MLDLHALTHLGFEAPARLLLLLLVAALAVAYVVVARRRRSHAVRFTDLDLLASVAPRRPGWRRHVPAGLLVTALALLTAAFARPVTEVEVPREQATVMVALDVSLSMQAEDVEPTRFVAAQEAATSFVESLPETFDVGLVSFAGAATVRVTPTEDHASVVAAIDGLQLAEGTAIGEGVVASLSALPAPAVRDSEEQAAPPARVVLLSDGTSTQGRPVEEAADLAVEAGVPVSTIAYGTSEGVVEVDGQLVPVPVDGPALQELADQTGGSFYEAASGDQLQDVYDDIGEDVGTTREEREVSAAVAGVALLFGFAAAVTSLLWSPRLP